MAAALVNMDGDLCVNVSSSIFGRNELGQPINIDSSARYNVAVAGQAITVTFSLTGARTLGIFGLGVSTRMKSAIGMTSKFGIKGGRGGEGTRMARRADRAGDGQHAGLHAHLHVKESARARGPRWKLRQQWHGCRPATTPS